MAGGKVPGGMSREERAKCKESKVFVVASNGTVEFRKGERTVYDYAIQRKSVGETLDLEFFRPKSQTKFWVRVFLYAGKSDVLC